MTETNVLQLSQPGTFADPLTDVLRNGARGIVNLIWGEQNESGPDARSRGRGGPPPLVRRLGSEDPQRRARDEMALMVEGVVDGGVYAEKALGRSRRLEPLHFALSPSHRLMRVFGPIVLAQPLLMRAG